MQILKTLIKNPLKKTENTGLIFLIHGYGSNEKDLFSFSDLLPSNDYIIALRAPILLDYDSFSWYDINIDNQFQKKTNISQANESIKMILKTINYFNDKFSIYGMNTLIGFSQGAILSWAIGLGNPHIVNRIAALSGFINTDFNFSFNSKSNKIKFFISHGIYDPIIPISYIKESLKFLKEKGLNLFLNEYKEGHGISKENFEDLLNWLNN